MEKTEFLIEGMSCQHCVGRVKRAIETLRGIVSVDVSIGKAVVDHDESVIGSAEIREAIRKAGYKTD
jgi:copper chaperone